jgi:DNA-directed RNA polymerase I, II, and III subunit RPABC2
MSENEETPMEETVQIIESEDETDSDSDTEDLKKFEQSDTKNLLIDFHPHLKHISNKEMYALSNVTRDKSGRIIDELHQTMPILTRYEKAKIIGLRAKQINNGSTIFIDIPHNVIEGLTIAEKELKANRIPFIIRRPLPNGGSEYWKVSDLEMLE